jgi:hypothetical protein
LRPSRGRHLPTLFSRRGLGSAGGRACPIPQGGDPEGGIESLTPKRSALSVGLTGSNETHRS